MADKNYKLDFQLTDGTTKSVTFTVPQGEKGDSGATATAYCICETAAATAAKVITVVDNSNWALTAGSMISVLFTYTNTASNPTFNVNGTGAKNVYYGASQITTSSLAYAGTTNRICNYIYDGTQFRFHSWGYDGNTNTYLRLYRQTSGYDGEYPLLVGRTKATSIGTVGTNSTYGNEYGVFREDDDGNATLRANPAQGEIIATKFTGKLNGIAAPYGTCSTAAATVAKAVTVDTFSLITGIRVTVKFTYANTASAPTLNVNSTGAKAIYWHGAALPDTQYWDAGSVLDFVYNGTQWELVNSAKGVGITSITIEEA